ncbi:CopD family protein [Flagellimonas sp.]|uniref:CopD family protein n=1 Tax=Flagellimonas sp. TaxID=2058762 RepID=UPI003F4A0629
MPTNSFYLKVEYYNYIKALHLIFVVTWFAGLFYIPRLFIYHIEALAKPSPEKEILANQLKLMTKRLWYIITWPSAVLCTVFAIWLLYLMPGWLEQGWMHVKLGFVLLLFVYHGKCHQIFKQLQRDEVKYTSRFMRIWNEVATLILFAVVFLVILKNAFNWIYGVVGIFVLAVLLMLGIRIYKRIREENPEA